MKQVAKKSQIQYGQHEFKRLGNNHKNLEFYNHITSQMWRLSLHIKPTQHGNVG